MQIELDALIDGHPDCVGVTDAAPSTRVVKAGRRGMVNMGWCSRCGSLCCSLCGSRCGSLCASLMCVLGTCVFRMVVRFLGVSGFLTYTRLEVHCESSWV